MYRFVFGGRAAHRQPFAGKSDASRCLACQLRSNRRRRRFCQPCECRCARASYLVNDGRWALPVGIEDCRAPQKMRMLLSHTDCCRATGHASCYSRYLRSSPHIWAAARPAVTGRIRVWATGSSPAIGPGACCRPQRKTHSSPGHRPDFLSPESLRFRGRPPNAWRRKLDHL